jgi:hypothetical protein
VKILFLNLCLFWLALVLNLSGGQEVGLHDFGADDLAYLSLPDQPPKASILLIPDALGTPEVVAARCNLLAKLGYIALTVDFYNGQVASSLEQAEIIQSRISSTSVQNTLSAALALLTQSPAYQSDHLIIAVWGPNMVHLKTVLPLFSLEKKRLPLVALSWVEPSGPLELDPFSKIPRPLQIITNNGAWLSNLEKNQSTQPLKQIPANLHTYNAAPGFMLKEETDTASAQAWAAMISFWGETVELANATQKTETPSADPTGEMTPASPLPTPTRKSSILPKR